MKLFLPIFIACFVLISPFTFEEIRDKLINAAYEYYEKADKPVDESVKTYIKRLEIQSYVYIKTLSRNDLIRSNIPKEIKDQFKYQVFSEQPYTAHKIDTDVYTWEASDKHYYGVVMHDGDIMYYILFELNAGYTFTFKLVESTQMKCKTTVTGAKDCQKVTKKVPDGVSEETYGKVRDYIKQQCIQKIKNHVKQMKELNGKVLYSFNEGKIEQGESEAIYNKNKKVASIYPNSLTCRIKLIIGDNRFVYSPKPEYEQVNKYDTSFQDEDHNTYCKSKDETITAYVTDDGFLNFMFRDREINGKRLIFKKKLFEPSGVLPYKFLISNDGDLLFYDFNNKLLGTIRNNNNFKDVDFEWPDTKYFWDKTKTIYFYVYNSVIYFENDAENARFSICYNESLRNQRQINDGYLIIDKKGILKHVNYKRKEVHWEIKADVKGDGPYSLDIFNFGLVLLNKDGEIYWTSHDESVEKINEEYKEYLKKINNRLNNKK